MLLADFRRVFFVLNLLDQLRSCWKIKSEHRVPHLSKKQMSKCKRAQWSLFPSHLTIKHPLPWQLSPAPSLLPKYKVGVIQHCFCHKGERTAWGPCLLIGVGSTCKGFLAHSLQQEKRKRQGNLRWEYKLLYCSYWPQRQLWMPSSDFLRFSNI